jgi:hypothetical protein
MQDQFTHYLSQTGQILRREIAVREKVIAARRDRLNLVNSLQPEASGS